MPNTWTKRQMLHIKSLFRKHSTMCMISTSQFHVQGTSKWLFPGCVKSGEKVALLFTYCMQAGERNFFTQNSHKLG